MCTKADPLVCLANDNSPGDPIALAQTFPSTIMQRGGRKTIRKWRRRKKWLRQEIRPEVVGGSHFHGSSNQRGGIKFVLGGRIENGMEGNRGKEASPTSTQKIMFVNLPHFETFQAQLWNSKNKRL